MPVPETQDDDLFGTTVPPSSLIVPSGAPGIPGSTGRRGFPSWTTTVEDFEVPEIGQQVVVTVEASTEWILVGTFVTLGEMMAQVIAVNDYDITLLRIIWTRGEVGPTGPQGIQGPVGPQGFPDDCPQDGTVYGRMDGRWVRLGAPDE